MAVEYKVPKFFKDYYLKHNSLSQRSKILEGEISLQIIMPRKLYIIKEIYHEADQFK